LEVVELLHLQALEVVQEIIQFLTLLLLLAAVAVDRSAQIIQGRLVVLVVEQRIRMLLAGLVILLVFLLHKEAMAEMVEVTTMVLVAVVAVLRQLDKTQAH
jgi:hypothetical protein